MKKKITQEDIAEWLGISGAFISYIRNGKKGFSPKMANDISNLTKIKAGMLIFGTSEQIYNALLKAYRKVKKQTTTGDKDDTTNNFKN